MESPVPEKQKPSHRLGSLNMVPGLGIEPRTRGFSIPVLVEKLLKDI
jgi:hypothetical protein